jgi:hypothetical protein
MSEQGDTDGIVRARLVAGLDLLLELLVNVPLTPQEEVLITRNDMKRTTLTARRLFAEVRGSHRGRHSTGQQRTPRNMPSLPSMPSKKMGNCKSICYLLSMAV